MVSRPRRRIGNSPRHLYRALVRRRRGRLVLSLQSCLADTLALHLSAMGDSFYKSAVVASVISRRRNNSLFVALPPRTVGQGDTVRLALLLRLPVPRDGLRRRRLHALLACGRSLPASRPG